MNELIDAVASAWRERTADGRLLAHPAWHDLTPTEREAAFDVAVTTRALEAALDPNGLSGTAQAVLARIRGR